MTLPAVINATEFKPACFSLSPNDGQSEDCLYLNVWVPVDATRPLAVMVWVHGGGFITGSSSVPQGGLLAAENDVIVVSMNYRQVGVFACSVYKSVNQFFFASYKTKQYLTCSGLIRSTIRLSRMTKSDPISCFESCCAIRDLLLLLFFFFYSQSNLSNQTQSCD